MEVPGGALAGPAELRLTPLSGQGLPRLLPLGFAPVAAFDLQSTEPLLLPATAHFTGVRQGVLHLVEYRRSTDEWHVADTDLVAVGGELSVPIPQAGSWALIQADFSDPPLEVVPGTMLSEGAAMLPCR